MFVVPRLPVQWQTDGGAKPWLGVCIRRDDRCGLRLLQRLDDPAAGDARCVLALGVPAADRSQVLEALPRRDEWLAGLRGATSLSERPGAPTYRRPSGTRRDEARLG